MRHREPFQAPVLVALSRDKGFRLSASQSVSDLLKIGERFKQTQKLTVLGRLTRTNITSNLGFSKLNSRMQLTSTRLYKQTPPTGLNLRTRLKPGESRFKGLIYLNVRKEKKVGALRKKVVLDCIKIFVQAANFGEIHQQFSPALMARAIRRCNDVRCYFFVFA